MEVRKGYKQTEVGELPLDWIIIRLGDISDVKTGPFGSSLHQKDYVEEGTPIITVEHLGDQGVVHQNLPLVSDSDKKRLSSYIIQTGDIVFSRVGSVDRNCLIKERENGWLFSGRLLRIRHNAKVVNPAYLSYYFHQEPTKQRIRNAAVGQTMASLNTQILKDIEVALPPSKSEQTAIATALSDTDVLITSLEKLIKKKRAIKQGAMQELLKPKEGWVVKKLGEILQVKHGKSQRDVIFENGNYPILASGGEIGRTNQYIYNKPSVLIGRKGTIDKPQFMETPFWSVDTLFYTEIFEGFDAKFVFYMFNQINWYDYNEASGVPSLNAKTIERIEEYFPKQISEQRSISKLLTDMDTEISGLAQKLSKYKLLKQGMMQELLTGKTRLV